MTEALAATLHDVAAALVDARAPWWVIGSAAVALHGGATTVADVDVLLALADAQALLARWDLAPTARPDAIFRSTLFARWTGSSLPVELMAGLTVRGLPIRPLTRVESGGVFVPARDELAALLRHFGRANDIARAALL